MPERIMFCSDCTLYGTPAPFNDDTCGNCGSHNVTIFLPVRGLTLRAVDAAYAVYSWLVRLFTPRH
jgi:hypothetical protein